MAFASDINTVAGTRGHGLFADIKARFARYSVYRKTLNELSSLDNRSLADLGICRSQVRAVAFETAYGPHA